MKYTLGIELEINGKKVKQDLVTLGLKALEKYTAYCKDFSEFIMYLRKTDSVIAEYLEKCSASFQPLYIKKEDERKEVSYDIPVLFKEDEDILLITQDELLELFDLPEDIISSMDYEDQLKALIKLKKEKNKELLQLLSSFNEKVDVIDKNGKPETISIRKQKYRSLKAELKKASASYINVVQLIRENVNQYAVAWRIETQKKLEPPKKVEQPSDKEIKDSLESKLKKENEKNGRAFDSEMVELLETLIAQMGVKMDLEAELDEVNAIDNTFLSEKLEESLEVCKKDIALLNHILELREQLREVKVEDVKEIRYLNKCISLYERKRYLESELRNCPKGMRMSEKFLLELATCESQIDSFEGGKFNLSDAGFLIENDDDMDDDMDSEESNYPMI